MHVKEWQVMQLHDCWPVHGKVFVSKNGLSGSMSRSFEGHNVTYQCKVLNQSNIVCEYEVNLLTNEKVITEKQNLNTNC